MSVLCKLFALGLLTALSVTGGQAGAQTLSDRQLEQIRSLSRQTQDPVALDLLEWAYLMNGSSGETFNAAMKFFKKHPQWPYKADMQRTIERLMPAEWPAANAIEWFRAQPPQTGRGLGIYLNALLRSGREGEIRKVLADRWPQLQMGADEQSRLRTTYKTFFTRDMDYARFDYLVYAGSKKAAFSMAERLGPGYRALAEARFALKDMDPGASGAVARVPSALMNDPGLTYERIRWRRQKNLNDGVLELLRAQPPIGKIRNAGAWWKERHIMVRRLIEQNRYREAYRLAAAHGQVEGFPEIEAEWTSGFIAQVLLNDPKTAFRHFKRVFDRAETALSKSRGAYWSGKAALLSGQKADGMKWMEVAAVYQHTYYGQEASKILQRAIVPKFSVSKGLAPNQSTQNMLRAVELLKKRGLKEIKAIFVGKLLSEYEDRPEEMVYIARWAEARGMRHEALQFSKKLAEQNILLKNVAYPVERGVMSHKDRVDPALVLALIRQESMFDDSARSPAGACGLMQLMPATAKAVARQNGISHNESWLIDRPAHNIRLGTLFFEDMIQRYRGSVPMALAAYNAGPGRVDNWRKQFGDPRKGELTMENWIELIPIYETRNYVQRILEAENIYRDIL